ncbi:hypothetical protein GC207_07625 [bacterium]|nr:hypothetical protein [bacterium]
MKSRNTLLVCLSMIAILGSAFSVWKTQFDGPKINVALQQGIGEALAEETIQCLDNKGDILVITMADGDSDILTAQFAAFRARIEKSRIRIKDVTRISSAKKGKYGPGVGLSVSKLTREIKKNIHREAVVSFVGLPKFAEGEFADLGSRVPPLFAFSRDAEKLAPLYKRGLIKAAIVPRFTFPAPGPESPRTPGEWFTNQYQLIRAENRSSSP